MLFLDIVSFRELSVIILGELSPSMTFLYDLIAVILCFLFFMIAFNFFTFFKRFIRW